MLAPMERWFIVQMTRQHFEALADLSASLITDLEADRLTADQIVKRVADLCASSNGRFDRGRFERVTLERAWRLGRDFKTSGIVRVAS